MIRKKLGQIFKTCCSQPRRKRTRREKICTFLEKQMFMNCGRWKHSNITMTLNYIRLWTQRLEGGTSQNKKTNMHLKLTFAEIQKWNIVHFCTKCVVVICFNSKWTNIANYISKGESKPNRYYTLKCTFSLKMANTMFSFT